MSRTVAALLVLVVLAGCQGVGVDSEQSAVPTVDEDVFSGTDGGGVAVPTVTGVSNGSGSWGSLPTPNGSTTFVARTVTVATDRPGAVEPVTVYVWNDAARNRSVAVRLGVTRNRTAVYDRTVAVPARGAVEFQLRSPARYVVAVEAAGDRHAVTLTRADFDCNVRSVWIRVGPDDRLSDRTIATTMACRAAG
jgi:hypothetical protein